MIIVRTPLRISLFGGGTDFPEYFNAYGGAVLGSSIDKYIYHSVSRFPSWLFDHKIRFAYRIVEHVSSLEDIQHVPFREILRFLGVTENIEVNLASDLPSFTGLGSSSSFTVGLINALHAYQGKLIDSDSLARTAIYIEREILKENVGFQDQIFSSFGGFNVVHFRGEDNFQVERLAVGQKRLESLSNNLLMYFTGVTRKASDIEEKKLAHLHLNLATLDKMRASVDIAMNILIGDKPLDDLGNLLGETWRLKRSLSQEVSNPLIDEIYNKGTHNGALGGKLLGAGGGGFLLFYVPQDRQPTFRHTMKQFHEVDFSINSHGSSIIHASA